jgi:hypothetical protein
MNKEDFQNLVEQVKHLTIKEDILATKKDMQSLRRHLIFWIILTPVVVYGTIVAVMFYIISALGHWKL